MSFVPHRDRARGPSPDPARASPASPASTEPTAPASTGSTATGSEPSFQTLRSTAAPRSTSSTAPAGGAPARARSGWVGEEPLLEDLPSIWGRRPSWQLPLRWLVAPLVVSLAVLVNELGFEIELRPVLLISAAHPIFSALVTWVYRKSDRRERVHSVLDRLLLAVEVFGDYTALLLLIYFTGGVWSPLTPVLILHVILAGIRFPGGSAYVFATWASIGIWLLHIGTERGWVASHPIVYRGVPLHGTALGIEAEILLLSLSLTFLLTALLVHRIMTGVRARVVALSCTTDALVAANRKLSGLYEIVRVMGQERQLQSTLDRVAQELVEIVGDVAVAIGLVEEDGRTLRFAASRGLPQTFTASTIEIARSPFHQRVLGGETVLEGRIDLDPTHQLSGQLAAIGIRSVLLAPLRVETGVLGTLGIYASEERRFREVDARFLALTAELVAISIEDARANEAIEALVADRTRFTLQVAHNLRAPLGAALGLLDLIASGNLGQMENRQRETVDRVVARLRVLDEMVAELLEIGRSRDWEQEIADVMVNLTEIARYVDQTYRAEAVRKGLHFDLSVEPNLPWVESGADLLLRIVENLVANAIKYTPEGGEVEVRFERQSPGQVRILVRDTGIGIPSSEQERLFEEFFRASNAKRYTALGTGLGLAFVRQAVERHRGHLFLASEEGEGTTIVVDLYEKRPPRVASTLPPALGGRPPIAATSYDRTRAD